MSAKPRLCSEPICGNKVFRYRDLDSKDKRRFKACAAGRCQFHCARLCGAEFDAGKRPRRKR